MTASVTTEQRDPVTLYTRSVGDIMGQIVAAVAALDIPCQAYRGTSMDGLARTVATALTQSGGKPAAIVCYERSAFGNHPRRTSWFNIVIVSSDTRPSPGMPGAIEAAWSVEAALDRLVTQDTTGECPQTDILEVEGEEAVQLKDAGAACAIVVTLTAKDY